MTTRAMRTALWTATLLVALGAAQGIAGVARAADKAVLRLNFTPWAMHAEYYAALNQGFYSAEGLDVEIRPAAAGQQNEVFVGTGREQFGVANADTFVKARSSDLPLIAISAEQPDNPFSVITLKSAGITQPRMLKGKKISWFPSNVRGLIDPLLASGGLTQDDVQFVTVSRGAEVQMLAAGAVDAVFGYYYGQALTLEMRGFPTDVMPVKDYGVNIYGTLIYTNENEYNKNPDLSRRFMRATLKGFIWSMDHMGDAMKYVIAVSPDRDLALETRKLGMIYDTYRTPEYRDRWGLMSDAKWAASIKIFKDAGDLQRDVSPSEIYTNEVLKALPQSQEFARKIFAKS